jgi:hypothetical protein
MISGFEDGWTISLPGKKICGRQAGRAGANDGNHFFVQFRTRWWGFLFVIRNEPFELGNCQRFIDVLSFAVRFTRMGAHAAADSRDWVVSAFKFERFPILAL